MDADNVRLSEWPDDGLSDCNLGRSGVDELLHGANSWTPAYGCQAPGAGNGTVLEKEDFLDSADADLFLPNSSLNGHYVYLETIQEETSDELQSESESRASPQGWLATDSESGSVIRMYILDDIDSGSEREIACPAKRRRQDYSHLTISDDESSLSRSSSLLQFESLEKQCQDISSSSPSIFSTFSYDSLENQRTKNASSPDSLDQTGSDIEPESSYYKLLKIDLPTKRFYNETQRARSDDSSESAEDSDETLEYDSCKSVNNLKTWRSFDCLSASGGSAQKTAAGGGGVKDKMSTENLSEDSGYSDNFSNGLKSNSNPSVLTIPGDKTRGTAISTKHAGFGAYDGDAVHANFTTNFGVSYQDLSAVDKYDVAAEYRSPLIDRFMRNGAAKRRADVPLSQRLDDDALNIDGRVECARLGRPKITAATFASVPNLQPTASAPSQQSIDRDQTASLQQQRYLCGKQRYCVSSVPSDLNLAADLQRCVNKWCFAASASIAEKNWDIGDLNAMPKQKAKLTLIELKDDSPSISNMEASSFVREASYLEAMVNSVDMSDDERQKKTTLAEFDQKVLKAISETSVNSICGSTERLPRAIFASTPISNQTRNVISTPNLSSYESNDDESTAIECLAADDGPVGNYHSTSTSGLSAVEDTAQHQLLLPTLSICGSKGVHFSPVVSEVNWRDDSESTIERESSYSLSSTPERELNLKSPQDIRKPTRILSTSQPELQKVKKLRKMHAFSATVSQPDMGLLRRDSDGLEPASTRNYVVKRYLSCDAGARTLYNRSPIEIEAPHQRVGAIEEAQQQRRERCTSANDAVNRRAAPVERSGSADRDDVRDALTQASCTSQMDRKKKSGDKEKTKEKQTTVQRIGGLWQKFSHFRFSTRAKSDTKSARVKSDCNSAPLTESNKFKTRLDVGNFAYSPTGQRYATKDDYIHIPLRGPSNNNVDAVDNERVSGKPPLPGSKLAPPRVIGLSMKTASAAPCAHIDPVRQKPARHLRGKEGATCSGGGRANHANAAPSKTTAAAVATSSSAAVAAATPMGLIETDLDTEVTVITSGTNAKTRSLMDLGASDALRAGGLLTIPHHHRSASGNSSDPVNDQRPHKSMEFLLDKQNLRVVEPPENNLQKLDKNVMLSEHELRVQRSLSRLTVPEWFKRYQQQRQSSEGLIPPRKPYTANSTSALHNVTNQQRERWPPTNQHSNGRTASFTSLTDPANVQSSPQPDETLTDQQHSFVRWSKSSKVSSAASSPCQSTRGSFNLPRYPYAATSPPSSVRSSFNGRAPYMGWRSQERLNRTPRTPAERLANSILLAHHQRNNSATTTSSDSVAAEKLIEVTSAIAHFVYDSGLVVAPPQQRADSSSSQETVRVRSRSASPAVVAAGDGQTRKYWMESSFVGTKPLDSPQTPLALDGDPRHQHNDGLMLTLTRDVVDGLRPSMEHEHVTSARIPSPATATLEDVLDSLLGLPSASRASSPHLGPPADRMVSASHELIPSPSSTPPPPPQNTPPSIHQSHPHPPLCGENEATFTNIRQRSRPPFTNGTIALPSYSPVAVDTDDDDQRPHPQQRRVSWEDEVRVYTTDTLVALDVIDDLPANLHHARILLQCNKAGCLRSALPNSAEGREFRPCHNCTTVYCTRQCRREDWDLHRIACDTIRVQNIIRQAIVCIKRLPKVMDALSVEARRGYIFRGPGTVKMYFGSIERAEQFLDQGASALGQFGYIAWTELLPGELETTQYCAMVDLCRNYNPENRFILYIVVCVEADIAPTGSGVRKMERKIVGHYVKLRLTGGALEELPLDSSPYRRLLSALPPPLTLILKAAPLPSHVDRARIFDRISNILCGRGISLRRQEPNHYAALRQYVDGGGTCATEGKPVRFHPINICARCPIAGQPDMYIVMVDATNKSVEDVVQTNCMRILVFDLINDRDDQLLLLPGAVAIAQAPPVVHTDIDDTAKRKDQFTSKVWIGTGDAAENGSTAGDIGHLL